MYNRLTPLNDTASCGNKCRYDSTAWATRESLLATLNDPSAWNSTFTSAGFVLDTVLGGIEKSPTGEITGAKVLAMNYLLASDKELIEQQKDDEPAKGWEQEFLDRMEVCFAIPTW